MRTEKHIVPCDASALIVVAAMINRSAWFCVEPLPDGEWSIEFKRDEGHSDAIRDALGPGFESKVSQQDFED